MLDRYWFGEVGRISPEAPVPVVKIDRVEERPGGAANVARNAAALEAHATLISVVGRDEPGGCLRRLLRRERVHTHLHTDVTVRTTIKLRVIGRQQQLVRIDFETPPTREALASQLRVFRKLLQSHDAVILSDYGKGGLTHIKNMIRAARAAGKPVLVDPKGDDYARYRNASLLTPNQSEFREVAGSWKTEAELTRKAHALVRELRIDALLITRSEEGMTLYREGSRHARACAGARSVRRERGRRHRDSDARRHGREGRRAGERRTFREQGRRHRRRKVRHRSREPRGAFRQRHGNRVCREAKHGNASRPVHCERALKRCPTS